MIPLLLSLLLSYLLGSISPAYLLGKWLKGIDLRQHGSGNVGATNVFRVLGRGPGVATLLLDVGKGAVAVAGLGTFFESRFLLPIDSLLFYLLMGIAVIAGHNWPLFLKFKGGKGVATSFGVLGAIAPSALLWGLATWILVTGLTRKVALGSLAAALATPIAMSLLHHPPLVVLLGIFMAISIFYTHRSNIRKIFFDKNHNPL